MGKPIFSRFHETKWTGPLDGIIFCFFSLSDRERILFDQIDLFRNLEWLSNLPYQKIARKINFQIKVSVHDGNLAIGSRTN